ncbi:pyridoxamine 5'-phosphate oxidase family protein [Caldalkalibacillus salinus]|uniref:pyridoxamine 5'-phosphate oxidase family protein n=1 Tax=Caldalkalibacillus salinus TaxID=2803787 RepID=UPI00192356E7|nr:pyridoxamine 5'-phosphate oxidase family protein [Caldalkalibacillus salinus]
MPALSPADIVHTEQELRTLVGEPSEKIKRKTVPILDEHCQSFIAKSPLLFISTADGNGRCDVSPRGDEPGFVHVYDEKHLMIPDRRGNKRMDTMRNILQNPHTGLVFVIPALGETLRINGKAYITKQTSLLEHMAVQGVTPKLGIIVEVEECFIHCAKAFKRANLWHHQVWPNQDDLPSIPKILSAHINLPDFTPQEVEAYLGESYTKRLY